METRNKDLSTGGGMKKSALTKELVRSFILYDFLSSVKPAECVEKLKVVMADKAPNLPTLLMIARWFNRFRSEDFSVEDGRREKHPKTATHDEMCPL